MAPVYPGDFYIVFPVEWMKHNELYENMKDKKAFNRASVFLLKKRESQPTSLHVFKICT